jgi:UDP-N-acetylmuramoylalanine--D-glutamate ligase
LNEKLGQFKKDIAGKKVAVIGLGISNIPLIKYLGKLGIGITAFDKADREDLVPALKALEGLKVEYSLGKDYLKRLKGFDLIFKTPVMRFDIPELLREADAGAEITSEMEVFCRLCPARLFGITGSDGKTTTATLIHRILEQSGYRCWLGGNVGTPLLDRIDEIDETDMVVLELSSFQLHTMRSRINTAVVTNISPNHLDVHTSMQEYIDAKKNIFLYQDEGDTLVLNYDNRITRGFAAESPGKVIMFSRARELDEGMVLSGGRIFFRKGSREQDIVAVDEIRIPGVHNAENYMAAAAATLNFAAPSDVRAVAVSFGGVEHRSEFVRSINGISFYNDSIGTSPTRTMATIRAFRGRVLLIAGGYDKHLSYDEMGEVLAEKTKCLVLLGQTSGKIEEALKEEVRRSGRGADIPVIRCDSMEEAVIKAYENAVPGDVVLLSPASASFDRYRNFEERGNHFKRIVGDL